MIYCGSKLCKVKSEEKELTVTLTHSFVESRLGVLYVQVTQGKQGVTTDQNILQSLRRYVSTSEWIGIRKIGPNKLWETRVWLAFLGASATTLAVLD